MKIVIAGAGVVGESLCSELSAEGNDVILIEKVEKILNRLVETYDITGLVGNGASYETLLEAGTDTADIFIAATESDELNIISSIIAKKLGTKFTIARVRNPEYSSNMQFVREGLGISLMINPEQETAKSIANKLMFPVALSVENFFGQRAGFISIRVQKDNFLNGMQLKELEFSSKDKVIICTVRRGEDVFIPSGDFTILEGDIVHIAGSKEAVHKFYDKIEKSNLKIDSALLVGGGTISHYLIGKLLENKIKVKVIENNKERAEKLSESYPKAIVIRGDEADQEFLMQEGINNYDSTVILTDSDEENTVITMFVNSITNSKLITKMNRTLMLSILEKNTRTSTVVPKKVISDMIISVVRSKTNMRGSTMSFLYRLESQVEFITFEINKNSRAIDISLKDLKIKKGTLIASILRDGKMIFPGGNDAIKINDSVMVVTTASSIEDFDDILE
ncbi:putative potassium transporter peripheral membrane component [Leptotrichia wadei]|jgi:K+ transport systems, NAD-binding component|uniref:Trk system potassium uptake protein TrkA n=1 Tax=Leptotrichia wadei TaxID=157687 RepID=A0A134A5Z0_9FUSO|nr:Trk system potassium transporter TrkA [Leptotrichia wadei]KXB63128.1 putative potassium transporter peripheral membrane component [Leptotrichia wadei]MBS6019213.1 Trk system potassium transporter TrkA [Leptotrichia wadei]BBM43468.1 potassium transporter peripheral membrane protein [Leptotrichia wadei]BBM48179.1 potassium transporter peripheral membrane protein [Leptotrichia wadei]BBM50516.1 potassium transporter peripheral membrane protein [Leptotrichia wadei]